MEVSDLLPDSSNEARSSVDELDDHGQPGDTDQRISSQGHLQNDAAKPCADAECEFIPDCGNVPSLSHDVSADISPTDADTDVDSDIFMYLALGATVLMLVLSLCKQVVK